MKRTMASMLILAVLSFWVPCASAEVSQDLDPMVSPDAQATVTSESPSGSIGSGQVSNTVSTADTPAPAKKAEETKKERKAKKSSTKKASTKKTPAKITSRPGAEHASKTSKKHKKSSKTTTESTTTSSY